MSLLILAGPAGVGKGSLVKEILAQDSSFTVSVSATTRQPRAGETEGVEYHFLTREQFEELIASNQLLEYALVHGDNYYGTLVQELTRAEASSKHLLMEIDLQGARQVKARIPESMSVFINPPSWEELENRLRGRGTETEDQIQTRLVTARTELDAAGEFDHQVTNFDLEQCAKEIIELLHRTERES
jgi:guanylate kinase